MKLIKPILKGCSLLLAAALIFSCDDDDLCIRGEGDVETRVVNLDSFEGVKVNGDSKVYVRKGAQQLVEVKGQPNVLDELETEVSNGIWQLEIDRCLRSHKTVEVFITVPEFRHAEINGDGSIELEENFEAAEFQALLNGSGSIKALTVADKVISRVNGSGYIDLGGEALQHDAFISGSGNIRAFDLPTKTTTVQISASGNAEVTVSETLDVNISGSGNVYYKGDPTITTQISGSGKVIKR
ncbi:head GIN domain-containing protein [Pontibacter ruber]|uniref:Head GIN domain-containing protein n=1 Tax=Pontibacter ruber TaxID=1343895 RepID=A0ABW5CW75_9BACT|nr:head GIN domain-containing protein [Pontibacter ruber]